MGHWDVMHVRRMDGEGGGGVSVWDRLTYFPDPMLTLMQAGGVSAGRGCSRGGLQVRGGVGGAPAQAPSCTLQTRHQPGPGPGADGAAARPGAAARWWQRCGVRLWVRVGAAAEGGWGRRGAAALR